jgi:hypothetical protein
LLMAAAVVALPGVANADFFVLDNPGDANFNQLLGIAGRIIVGYFGDGSVVPNNGYVLVPQNHYSVENFTNLPPGDFASQTQAIGINNRKIPEIVGFYTDNATGFTHGFLDVKGVQLSVDDPKGLPPNVTTPSQNLLGINNNDKAAGFWTDNDGNFHGFVVDINPIAHTFKFVEVGPKTFPGAVSSQVTGINNNNEICGFWTDANGNTKSFFGPLGGTLTSFSVTTSKPVKVTQALGCNDRVKSWALSPTPLATCTVSPARETRSRSSMPMVRAKHQPSAYRARSLMGSTIRAISSAFFRTARKFTVSWITPNLSVLCDHCGPASAGP